MPELINYSRSGILAMRLFKLKQISLTEMTAILHYNWLVQLLIEYRKHKNKKYFLILYHNGGYVKDLMIVALTNKYLKFIVIIEWKSVQEMIIITDNNNNKYCIFL